MNERELLNKMKYLIKKKRPLEYICLELGLKEYEVFNLVEQIQQQGYIIDYVNDYFIMRRGQRQKEVKFDINGATQSKLMFISDTHLGSRFDRIDLLSEVYRQAEDLGITTVLHSGDLTDGFYPNRPHYDEETKVIGWCQMLDYVLEKYPHSNVIQTLFIGGNHDFCFQREFGRDIGEEISKHREDLVYLGDDSAEVDYGKTKIRLFHGSRKLGCTKDQKMRTYVESLPEDKVPDILLMGHYHNAAYMKYKQTHCFQVPAMIDPTPYATRAGFINEKGVWIANLTINNEGDIIHLESELMDLNDQKRLVHKKQR